MGRLPRLCAEVAGGSPPKSIQLAQTPTPVRASSSRLRIPHACAQVHFVQQSLSFGTRLGLGAHNWSPPHTVYPLWLKPCTSHRGVGNSSAFGRIIHRNARAVWPSKTRMLRIRHACAQSVGGGYGVAATLAPFYKSCARRATVIRFRPAPGPQGRHARTICRFSIRWRGPSWRGPSWHGPNLARPNLARP